MTAQAGDTPLFSIAARKRELRSVCRETRRAIPQRLRQRAARQAARHLLRRLPPRCRIAIYLSVQSELSTEPLRRLLARHGHRVAVPVTLPGWQLRFVPFDELTRLRRRGPLRLPEPALRKPRLPARAFDVIVVPLLAFDACGGRLGNGGGYYDRALAARRVGRQPLRLGYGYATQQCESLPMDHFDMRLDAVVTERGWRRLPDPALPARTR